jgi:hypothetical protein
MADDYTERIDVLQDDPHYPPGTIRLFIRWAPAGGHPISGVHFVFPEDLLTDEIAGASVDQARQRLRGSMSAARDGQCPPRLESTERGKR